MHTILLFLPLLPVRLPKLILFNPRLPEKIQIKRKGRVRIRRTRIIIHNLINPKCKLLMIKTNVSLTTPTLSVVATIIRNIVQDVPKLLSSSNEPKNLLHLPFCHKISLLNKKPDWSFMTKLPLPLHPMSLCVLVTQKRTKLQSELEPRITLC
jgi:hypothetical protein